MSRQHERHSIYRACLHLYPRQHRKIYSEQMVQTLDDMLADQRTSLGRLTVRLKVGVELPVNAFEETINGIGDISVNKLTKITAKQYLYSFFALLIIGSYAILSVSLISQHHQNKILGDRIDMAEQNQLAMSGNGYTAASIAPSENAVYLPQVKLKLTDTRLNEQLVYTYVDARPEPNSKKIFPAQLTISTHDLSVNNFAAAQFDCSEVVYADFVTPSYPLDPTYISDGKVILSDGRTMNIYYAPSIKGCSQTWKMNNINSKAIAGALKQASSY